MGVFGVIVGGFGFRAANAAVRAGSRSSTGVG